MLPVGYFRVVFTLPAEVADIALPEQSCGLRPAVPGGVRDDDNHRCGPKTSRRTHRHHAVLHTWGSAMTHHPQIHMIVPGGGLLPDGSPLGVVTRSVPAAGARARQAVPPPVPDPADSALRGGTARVLWQSRSLADRRTFLRHLSPARKKNWVVNAKPPFAGTQQNPAATASFET